MIEDERADRWAKFATAMLMRHLGKNQEVAFFASIVLASLADRDDRERWISEQH